MKTSKFVSSDINCVFIFSAREDFLSWRLIDTKLSGLWITALHSNPLEIKKVPKFPQIMMESRASITALRLHEHISVTNQNSLTYPLDPGFYLVEFFLLSGMAQLSYFVHLLNPLIFRSRSMM